MYAIKKIFTGNNLKQSAKLLQPSLKIEETKLFKQANQLEQKIEQYSNLTKQIDTFDGSIGLLELLEKGEISLPDNQIESLATSLRERQALVSKAQVLKHEIKKVLSNHSTKVKLATNLVNSQESIELANKNNKKQDYNTMVDYSKKLSNKLDKMQSAYYKERLY